MTCLLRRALSDGEVEWLACMCALIGQCLHIINCQRSHGALRPGVGDMLTSSTLSSFSDAGCMPNWRSNTSKALSIMLG